MIHRYLSIRDISKDEHDGYCSEDDCEDSSTKGKKCKVEPDQIGHNEVHLDKVFSNNENQLIKDAIIVKARAENQNEEDDPGSDEDKPQLQTLKKTTLIADVKKTESYYLPFTRKIIENSQKAYKLPVELSLDESIIEFSGRSIMRQRVPNKPAGEGIKNFSLTCAHESYL